jgi:hypothetical protein
VRAVNRARAKEIFLREVKPISESPSFAEVAVFPMFSSSFDHLLNSQEKTINREGNCLTVLETANIMPDGSRDFPLATAFREPSLSLVEQNETLAAKRFFETLGNACGAGTTEQVK